MEIINSAYCFRYIVPFAYKVDTKFEDLCEQVDGKKIEDIFCWKREEELKVESDLFAYIGNEFICNDKLEIDKKNGVSWISHRWKNSKEKYICCLKLIEEKPKANIEIYISQIGLYLFRNGLGFVWYEIEWGKSKINVDEVIDFQYKFKELNFATNTFVRDFGTFREDKLKDVLKERGLNEREVDTIVERVVTVEEKGEIKEKRIVYVEQKDFSLGNWLAERISFLQPEYFASRKNSYKTKLGKIKSENKMGVLREVPEYVPDKALLYTYAALNASEKETIQMRKEEVSFYLTNGYKSSYRLSEETCVTMKRPFANMIWNATKEGCSILSWPDTVNDTFFTSNMLDKIRIDYFKLYIKCLFQSYSLLVYAEKIQNTLSAVTENYLNKGINKKLTELSCEINLFLTKSMATSVSHVDHQSQFFIYLKEKLKVHEDVKSVTAGLTNLENLQSEKQRREAAKHREEERESDERIEAVMCLFSVLTIASALCDVYSLASNAARGSYIEMALKGRLAFVVTPVLEIVIIAISAIVFFWSMKRIISAWLRKKKNN